MTDYSDSLHVHDQSASEGWTMAAEEYGYTSPFGGPPVEIELYESAAAPVDQMGADLMGFLTDFRTGQREVNQPKPDPKADGEGPSSEAVRGQSRFEFHTKEPEEWVDPYAGSPKPMGPDWWQASDGKWYPSELHPDRQAPVAAQTEPAAEPHPIDPSTGSPASDEGAGRKRRFSFGR
jgi:hypothetical protein